MQVGDTPIPPVPGADSISCIRFSPTMMSPTDHLLAAAHWDGKVRVYNVSRAPQLQGIPRAEMDMQAPLLDVCWYHDSSKVFTAGCDGLIKCWDLATNQVQPMGKHDAPVKGVRWVQAVGMIVSGSWDRTIRFWKPEQPGVEVFRIQCPGQVLAMDVQDQYLCVACAGPNESPQSLLAVFDVRQPQTPAKSWYACHLKLPIRCVAAFPKIEGRNPGDKVDIRPGFACGSIEGRVCICYLNPTGKESDFAFKCHRLGQNGQDVYAVNSIAFHRKYGTFATAGSDGSFHFWDKDSKQRLKMFKEVGNSISSCDFTLDGEVFAYAIAYDWSKGYDLQNRQGECIMLHVVKEADIRHRRRDA